MKNQNSNYKTKTEKSTSKCILMDYITNPLMFDEEILKYSKLIEKVVVSHGEITYDSNQFKTGNQKSSAFSGIDLPAIFIIPIIGSKDTNGVDAVALIDKISITFSLINNAICHFFFRYRQIFYEEHFFID